MKVESLLCFLPFYFVITAIAWTLDVGLHAVRLLDEEKGGNQTDVFTGLALLSRRWNAKHRIVDCCVLSILLLKCLACRSKDEFEQRL